MPRLTRLSLIIVVLALVACSGGMAPTEQPLPTEIAAPTATRTPIPTVLPAAEAPAPTATRESATQPAPPTAPPAPELAFPTDLPLMELNVELFYTERWMRIAQRVELTAEDAWEEVVFNAPIASVEDAFYLDAVTVQQGGISQNAFPELTSPLSIIRVPLAETPEPGDEIVITMNYRVVIPPVDATSWPPVGTTGWTMELIQAGEFYPALVPYLDGEWQAVRYHPVGDPTIYALTDTRLNVTTDAGITVVSGGLVEQEGNTWRFRLNGARGVAFFASDRYRVAEGEANGIPIASYFHPEHEIAGRAAVQVAADSLVLYEDLFGPYPYESLTVVENGFFGGMEYTALASITDYAYIIYRENPDSVLHALISHEVAHQWWYGAVGNNQATEAWLDESLGFYGELLYYEHYHPALVDWWWQARVYQFDTYGPVDASIYSYSQSSDFILSMYGQAAQFTQDLRDVMGDEAFFSFLQEYYRTYYGQIVTGADFFAAARQHTDADLSPLIEAYFSGDYIENEVESTPTGR